MQIIFYKCNDASNVINKVLTGPIAADVKIRGVIDINNFSLRVRGDFTGQNYCYIPDVKRYYFIEKVERLGRVFEISLNCDLLETFKDDILQSKARFRRKLKKGDYVNVGGEKDIRTTITKSLSNYTMGDKYSIIVSTIGAN